MYPQLSNEKIGVQGTTTSKGPSQDGCPDRLARECTQVAPFIFRLLLRRKALRQEGRHLDKGGAIPARLETSEEMRPLRRVSSQAGLGGVGHAVTGRGAYSQ